MRCIKLSLFALLGSRSPKLELTEVYGLASPYMEPERGTQWRARTLKSQSIYIYIYIYVYTDAPTYSLNPQTINPWPHSP